MLESFHDVALLFSGPGLSVPVQHKNRDNPIDDRIRAVACIARQHFCALVKAAHVLKCFHPRCFVFGDPGLALAGTSEQRETLARFRGPRSGCGVDCNRFGRLGKVEYGLEPLNGDLHLLLQLHALVVGHAGNPLRHSRARLRVRELLKVPDGQSAVLAAERSVVTRNRVVELKGAVVRGAKG